MPLSGSGFFIAVVACLPVGFPAVFASFLQVKYFFKDKCICL